MAEKTNTLDYSIISKRRNDLFGISIVSIVIFHFFLLSEMTVAKEYRAFIGSVGVPIFLILSGMGLFFSMSRNADLKNFYKKRLVRVVIPYLIVSVVHFFVRYILIEGKGVLAFIKGILFVDFITQGNSQFWFILLIMLMYIVFPLLFHLFKSGKMNFLKLMILLVLIIGGNYLFSVLNKPLFDNISVMMTRIPSFVIGVYIGEKVYNKRPVQVPFWLITLAGSAVFLYYSIEKTVLGHTIPTSMLIRYGETVYALLLIMVLSIVLEAIHSATFSKICAFFGAMSLELYMVHVSMRSNMGLIGIPPSNPLYYAGMAVLAVGICYFLQKFDGFAAKKLTAGKK